MRRVLTVASVLGGIGVVETFLLLILAKSYFGLGLAELQTVIFLKLAVAGHLTLLVARSHRPFFAAPYPAPILLGAILGTQLLAVLIAGLGWFVTPIPWAAVGLIWLYCLLWLPFEDWAKLGIYRHLQRTSPRHRQFVNTVQQLLHPHGRQ
jgi:H+-transporting ATPase